MSHNPKLPYYLSIAGHDFGVDIPINFCYQSFYASNVMPWENRIVSAGRTNFTQAEYCLSLDSGP